MTQTHNGEIREIILVRIAEILQDVYHEPMQGLTSESVLARLAFKSEPRLNELRLALERLDRNEYGLCIFCKSTIPMTILRVAPTAHFCESCANGLRRRATTSQPAFTSV